MDRNTVFSDVKENATYQEANGNSQEKYRELTGQLEAAKTSVQKDLAQLANTNDPDDSIAIQKMIYEKRSIVDERYQTYKDYGNAVERAHSHLSVEVDTLASSNVEHGSDKYWERVEQVAKIFAHEVMLAKPADWA